jgi:predicted DsbA family dithiol-disulfide isomerase
MKVTYFLEVLSSWCFWAEPAWAELQRRYAGRVEFRWDRFERVRTKPATELRNASPRCSFLPDPFGVRPAGAGSAERGLFAHDQGLGRIFCAGSASRAGRSIGWAKEAGFSVMTRTFLKRMRFLSCAGLPVAAKEWILKAT